MELKKQNPNKKPNNPVKNIGSFIIIGFILETTMEYSCPVIKGDVPSLTLVPFLVAAVSKY